MGAKILIEKHSNTILWLLTAMMFAFPVIPSPVRPVCIVLFVIGSIWSSYYSKQQFRWRYFLLNASVFIVYLISLTYSDDVSYGFRKIETGASLIVFPLIFSLISIKHLNYIFENIHKLMWIFITTVLIANLAFFIKFYTHYNFVDSVQHFPNIIRSDIYGWNIHPIYLSMHVAIAIIFSLFLIKKGLSIRNMVVLLLMDLVLILFLLIMIKKGPILGLVMIMSLLVVLFKNRSLWIFYGSIVTIVIGVIIFHPKVNSKFSELLEINKNNHDELTSTNIRMKIYDCAVEITSDAGILGFGLGDGKNQLVNCYVEKEAFALSDSQYNSHNQYLGFILNIGYLGLIFFLLFVGIRLIKAYSNKNYLALAVVLFYCIVMFSENILEREQGVIFFSFFANLLFLKNSKYLIESTKKKQVENVFEELNVGKN